MACGGCGGGKRKLRSQLTVTKASKGQKTVKVQRVRRRSSDRPVSIERQHVVPHTRCPSCGYPTMLVHIGGRERQQCSNANCRQIIK